MKVFTGKIQKPVKAVLYGPEGIGKSTFASHWPAPLFIDIEKGTNHLEVSRTETPSSWNMLKAQIDELTKDAAGFKTLVIDTADWADRLAQAHICAKASKEGIEDFGYGKGWTYLAEEWKHLLDKLTELQEKQGMNVLFLAHAQMRKFEQPDEAGAYDRWELKMEKKSSSLLKEWADELMFCNYKTLVVEDEKTKTKKAKGGERVIYTSHHPAWDAKTRSGLQECITLKDGPLDLPFLSGTIPAPAPKKEAPKATPPPVQQQKPAPVEKTTEKPVEKAVEKTVEPAAPHLKKLQDLMALSGVQASEIQAVVAKRGYYPKDTPIANYDPQFVNGCLIGAWEKVSEMIKQLKNQPQAA